MRIQYRDDKNKEVELEVKGNLKIQLNADVDINLKINNFGELEVQKIQFGAGSSGLKIAPHVSNEISVS